jgi:hypothetical protein
LLSYESTAEREQFVVRRGSHIPFQGTEEIVELTDGASDVALARVHLSDRLHGIVAVRIGARRI